MSNKSSNCIFKNKKVVIFDLDGTLIDSMGMWNKVDKELIKKISGQDVLEMNEIQIGKQRDLKLKEYSGLEDMYLEYCGFLKEKYQSKMNKEEIKALRYELASYYLVEEIDYKPNAEKFLNYLKEKGFVLLMATTTNENSIDIYKKENNNIRSKANFEDIFYKIYVRKSVNKSKPHPDVYYKILEELQVKEEECLVIEDSLIGVQVAKNASIDVITIYDVHSDSDREEISKISNYEFNDFEEMLDYVQKECID